MPVFPQRDMIRRPRRAAFAALLACAACGSFAAPAIVGSGHAAAEDRPASGFTRLAVSVPGEIELVQGPDEGVSVAADDNVLPRVQTVVDHGTLLVRFARGAAVRTRTPIRVTVRARSIESVAVTGSAALHAAHLEAGRLALRLAGSASALLPATAVDELDAHLGGHCHLSAAGRARVVALSVAGAGEVNLARLEARRATVRIAGSADVAAWVHESLEAAISGSGSVRYFGDPAIRKSVSGSGAVERLGAAPP